MTAVETTVPEVTVRLTIDEIREIADRFAKLGVYSSSAIKKLVEAIPPCNDGSTLGGIGFYCALKFGHEGLHGVIIDDIHVEWP